MCRGEDGRRKVCENQITTDCHLPQFAKPLLRCLSSTPLCCSSGKLLLLYTLSKYLGT